jgi:hypothetical protein
VRAYEHDALLSRAVAQRQRTPAWSPGRFVLWERDTARSESTSIFLRIYRTKMPTTKRALPGIVPRDAIPVKQISGDYGRVHYSSLVSSKEGKL